MARQGLAPPDWRVFTGTRSAVGGFFRGTSRDPDPLLVISSDAAVEYISEKKPLHVVVFRELSRVRLRAKATTTRDSPFAQLHAWLDLHDASGGKQEWRTVSFKNNLAVLQAVIESFAVHRARLRPRAWA